MGAYIHGVLILCGFLLSRFYMWVVLPSSSEWTDGAVQKPERAEILRLIYMGRFLHESTKLSGESHNGADRGVAEPGPAVLHYRPYQECIRTGSLSKSM